MAAALHAAWSALRFDAASLQRWSARRSALAWGLSLLLAASLAGGLASALAGAQACLHRPPPGPAERRISATLADWLARSPLPPDVQHELVRNAAAALQLRGDLASLPRPLGRQAGCALEGLQLAVAAPYRRLALWLPYTLAAFAIARALGSRAGLAQTLAASTLYALPHLLDFLQATPGWGAIFAIVLSAWGAAIYAWAMASISGLGRPRALIALTLPALAAATLAAVLLAGVVVIL